jgi:hypothetical protein
MTSNCLEFLEETKTMDMILTSINGLHVRAHKIVMCKASKVLKEGFLNYVEKKQHEISK